MDLALRLSKQEASVSALRQQQEEEAVMKAIHESVSTEWLVVLFLLEEIYEIWIFSGYTSCCMSALCQPTTVF